MKKETMKSNIEDLDIKQLPLVIGGIVNLRLPFGIVIIIIPPPAK